LVKKTEEVREDYVCPVQVIKTAERARNLHIIYIFIQLIFRFHHGDSTEITRSEIGAIIQLIFFWRKPNYCW